MAAAEEAGVPRSFKFPTGECADRHGNVWIGDYLRRKMLEYSHEGRLLNTIKRQHFKPWSCAVNPVNGDLAIFDMNKPHAQPGEILVYSSPSAIPVIPWRSRQCAKRQPITAGRGD